MVHDHAARSPFASWSCCARPPGTVTHPAQLSAATIEWLPAPVPGTGAAALKAAGRWNIDQPLDADADDWWYRTTFARPALPAGQMCYLVCDGLATLAEIWLNGNLLLTTDNMFRSYRVDLAAHLQEHNELVLGFRSLTEDLKQKRSRPRWKTNLVSNQQLRWRRTTLLGRIPGWSPPVTPVGPWRAVRLETGALAVSSLRIVSTLEQDVGTVNLHACLASTAPLDSAVLNVAGHEAPATLQGEGNHLHATLSLPGPPLWWPHTHGVPTLLPCTLHVRQGSLEHVIPCGKVGFRRLETTQEPGFGIRVNGEPVYCRGACWTNSDIVTLAGTDESLLHDLHLARAAGVNMLRVGGTMVYESDRFYNLCDELGILVWQDFMFANMDYPAHEPHFAASIEAEAQDQLTRLAAHPSVAVYCGNSEVEQQAAMLGVPRELWRSDWFAQRLPALCAEFHPGCAYVPSTPSGGTLPFHVSSGITHYYGVGAYLRSPLELRKADVKFTPECLGFANIPEPATIAAVAAGTPPALHHPNWKRRVPRDTGTGWDFDDVRDFYLKQFFGVDPVHLRSFDMPRYVQLSRVVSGEMMAQAYAEWRSGHSRNQGALIWFYKDLWPGAGWGIVDSLGVPKAAYYYLRRIWLSRQLTVTDEGLDGLHVHVTNEADSPLDGFVEVLLLKDQHIVVARQDTSCRVDARSRQTFGSDEILGGFYDVCYAYRFGPPKHDLVVATLYGADRQVLSEAFHFVEPRTPALLPAIELTLTADKTEQDRHVVTLRADRFLQNVCFDVEGFLPDDSYFHLVPGRTKTVHFTPHRDGNVRFRGYVEALNLREPCKIPVM